MVARNLAEQARTVHCFAYVLNDFASNLADVKSEVYNHWDSSATLSPPKTRVAREEGRQSQPGPSLELLAWAQGSPVFPSALLTRFQEGSDEHAKLLGLKKNFDGKFPGSSQPQPLRVDGGRAGGVCDFTVDSNRLPVDHKRMIDLPHTSAENFSVVRPGRGACQFYLW